MKYINSISIILILTFFIKRMFFDTSINLGLIDEHYGVVFAILLVLLLGSEFLLRRNRNKNKDQ